MKPWLYLPASWSHFLSPVALKFYSRMLAGKPVERRPFHWKGLYFSNPLGIAGGVDKNALHLKEWTALGVGFLEIGTVTLQPQKSNPGKILCRSLKHQSLWNRMGFPSKGMDFVQKQLQKSGAGDFSKGKGLPLFINIGKNRETPLDQAVQDYKELIRALYPFAGAFVINISSPNTKDLRGLFAEDNLLKFLKSIKGFVREQSLRYGSASEVREVPLILKLSPDEDDVLRIVEQSLEAGIEGWCICNSTKSRSVPGLFPEEGGVSGRLLSQRSLELLKEVKGYLVKHQIQDKLLISCGGILTVEDIKERLQAGADLIQVYSALVFEGPGFFQSALKKLAGF